MHLLNKVNRIRRIDEMIRTRRTGPPAQFARALGMSRSRLFETLQELRTLGAPIGYCRDRQSYEYLHPVEFHIGFVPPEA